MERLTLNELAKKLEERCREESKVSEAPKMKISFTGADALWISEGEAKVRGKNDATEYYKFWEASEFKDFADAEDVLNDEGRMQMVEKVEVFYTGGKKEFKTWREFLGWLKG
jgi:hypothetical protein